ncbi:MAG: YajQ family cyclic di-GMP-binding protein [Coriobacteriales bacterium]|nr:YajQ family cyclic di-GMP-binding protein [Coriobacteriales bacterium]
MAKDSSFDIVSEVDMQEVDNAFQQTRKELTQRYDLKDSNASLELDKTKGRFTLSAPSEFVANQVKDVLNTKLVHRKIDLAAVRWGEPQSATGMTIRIFGDIIAGIDKDTSGKINKDIRAQKYKNVKVQIEGDKLRVFSPSRDALQEVITFVKEQDYGQPLQFNNYR